MTYKNLSSTIRDLKSQKTETHSEYTSICSAIRNVAEQRKSIEKHEKDQLVVGVYKTKNFEMQPKAQLLYDKLPKNTSPADAEKSAILQDKLFSLEKFVTSKQTSSQADVDAAEKLVQQIKHHAKAMNLEKEHEYISDNLDNIKKFLIPDEPVVNKADDETIYKKIRKRMVTPPYDRNPEPKKDMDLDSKNWLVNRNLRAQRKIKIIDGD